jgi:hypothetical protein
MRRARVATGRQNMLREGLFLPVDRPDGGRMAEKGRITDSGMAFAQKEWRMKQIDEHIRTDAD